MTDVPTVGDSLEVHLLQPAVGLREGRIEAVALGHHRQHPAAGAVQGTGGVAAGAGMKQLALLIGDQIQPDRVAFAWRLRITSSCLLYTSDAADE